MMFAIDELLELRGGERPFRHFAVAAFGNVDRAERRHLLERFRRSDDSEPTSVLNERVEESPQPTLPVNVVLRTRPDTKFLTVVAEDDNCAWLPLSDRP